MDQSSPLQRVKKPLLLTFDEAQYALGWDDARMATITPVTGFRSKAAERRWPTEMKFGSIYLPHLEDYIAKFNRSRLPFLAEAVLRAQRRLSLIDVGETAIG